MIALVSRTRALASLAGLAGLAGVAIVTSACGLSEPGPFGRVCSFDLECGDALVCLANRCVAEPDPEDVHGLTCDDPLPLVLVQDPTTARFSGRLELPATAPAPEGAASCEAVARSGSYVVVDVPTPMSLRVHASGAGKRTFAVMDEACTVTRPYGCLENEGGTGASDVVIPTANGRLRVLVSSVEPTIVEVEQVECPRASSPRATPDAWASSPSPMVPVPARATR